MRILIIQGGSSSGLVTGEEVVINNDVAFLRENGDHVFLENIKLPQFGWRFFMKTVGGLFWSFSNFRKVKVIIDAFKPDLVHFHTVVPYLSFSVFFAANSAKIPIVQTLHNGRWLCVEGGYFAHNAYCADCVGTYGWNGVRKGCAHGWLVSFILFINNFILRKFGFLFKSVSEFIAVSDFVKMQHVKSGFPENKITVRNNGFLGSSILHRELSWMHRKGVVYAGRLSVAKGSKVLEYLIKRLDCEIFIIGNGPELDSLKEVCIANKFTHVIFFGRLSNSATLDIIKKSEVALVPSQCGDSYPTVALESLSVGTPLVVSDLGGLPDIIKASKGGILAKHDEYGSYLKGIQELLEDKQKALKMGADGMSYIKNNVTIQKQGVELINIYKRVIRNYGIKD
jgi:glycosyltransferase involved in cell wall biosynthesis